MSLAIAILNLSITIACAVAYLLIARRNANDVRQAQRIPLFAGKNNLDLFSKIAQNGDLLTSINQRITQYAGGFRQAIRQSMLREYRAARQTTD